MAQVTEVAANGEYLAEYTLAKLQMIPDPTYRAVALKEIFMRLGGNMDARAAGLMRLAQARGADPAVAMRGAMAALFTEFLVKHTTPVGLGVIEYKGAASGGKGAASGGGGFGAMLEAGVNALKGVADTAVGIYGTVKTIQQQEQTAKDNSFASMLALETAAAQARQPAAAPPSKAPVVQPRAPVTQPRPPTTNVSVPSSFYAPARAVSSSGGIQPWMWAAGGVGVLGVGTVLYFALRKKRR